MPLDDEFSFGPFCLVPRQRKLLENGAPVRLGSRAFDILVALVDRAGETVSNADLIAHVWPDTVVEPGALRVHMAGLRKVLGDERADRHYVVNVPQKGYRFVAPVTRTTATAAGDLPDAAPAAARHNLPRQLTSFIGRERELADIAALLATTRLLTLTGAGGCGKTRLALHLAEQLAGDYPDGVFIVELAALKDAHLVAHAVANTLQVAEHAHLDIAQALAEQLLRKRLLLVLDNAEHLLEACAVLADLLLRRCPLLVVLVTSREHLGVAGELTYRVPSLSVPDAGDDSQPAKIEACESVRLFIDRVRLQQPNFRITHDNAAAVAIICRRLDGIALALELAAPRAASMSMEELRRHLDDRFRLVTGGSRTALPRHRTLRSLIDWSYDLLDNAEKAVLQHVSVFAGGWTLAAAEQVCCDEGGDPGAVLDRLALLVEKSLVLAEPRGAQTRYGLLETVRDYARDRLVESSLEAQLQRRHLVWCLAVAEASEGEPATPDPAAVRRLQDERDNMRAALSRCAAAGGDVVAGLRLAGALSWFWMVRSDYAEGLAWFSALQAAAPRDIDPATRATALRGAARLAWSKGDYVTAKSLCVESLALWKALGNQVAVAQLLAGLGSIAHIQGDYPDARALFDESLVIRRTLGDPAGIVGALLMIGNVAIEWCDFATARAAMEESLALSRSLSEAPNAHVLFVLGLAEHALGDRSVARERLEECVILQRESQDRRNLAAVLTALARIAQEEGDWSTAVRQLDEALRLMHEIGARHETAEALEAMGATALTLAGPGIAARIWGGAEKLREEMATPMPPSLRLGYERHVAAARAARANDTAFDRDWQEGRLMPVERLVPYALALGDLPVR